MALGYVHAQGVVHRDIKPSNLLLTPDLNVKIADFGVAQFANEPEGSGLIVAGSPKYMSPEQIAQTPLNGQSDVFALGVVLYELLTGRHPFGADSLGDLQRNILCTEPPALDCGVGPFGATLTKVLARALAKDRVDRYQTAYAFASDLLLLHDMLARHRSRSLGAVIGGYSVL
jgi:eukaryotic-like serine/threonine-protein kinase